VIGKSREDHPAPSVRHAREHHGRALCAAGALSALALLACAQNPSPATGAPAREESAVGVVPTAPAEGASRSDTTGFLDRDDITVRMAGDGLIVDILPMNAEVVGLATDDLRTFFEDALKKVPDSVPPDLQQNGAYFLVGFSATQKEISFEPSRVALNSEGRQYYPAAIVPIGRGFESKVLQILAPPVWAVYIYEPGIDLVSTLEFTYADELSTGTAWRNVVQAVELARSRAKR
jgi:hypothetical protein